MSEFTWWDGTGVDVATLRAEVTRLAEERSDYKANCVYTNTRKDYDYEKDEYLPVIPLAPGCIVGKAIFNITGQYVPDDMEGNSICANDWRRRLGESLLDEEESWYPPNEKNSSEDFLFVYHIQRKQDNGHTWGDALAMVLEHEAE